MNISISWRSLNKHSQRKNPVLRKLLKELGVLVDSAGRPLEIMLWGKFEVALLLLGRNVLKVRQNLSSHYLDIATATENIPMMLFLGWAQIRSSKLRK